MHGEARFKRLALEAHFFVYLPSNEHSTNPL